MCLLNSLAVCLMAAALGKQLFRNHELERELVGLPRQQKFLVCVFTGIGRLSKAEKWVGCTPSAWDVGDRSAG